MLWALCASCCIYFNRLQLTTGNYGAQKKHLGFAGLLKTMTLIVLNENTWIP